MRKKELIEQYNVEEQLKVINENQDKLWKHIFGNYNLFTKYSNPLRADNNPDCKFYVDESGKIKFNDFAYKNYDIIAYTQDKYKITFKNALKVLSRLSNILEEPETEITKKFTTKDYSVGFTPFQSKNNTYFTFKPSEYSHIYKLDKYIFNGVLYEFTLTYLYTTPDGGQKIYNPYADKKNKWKTITNTNLVDLEWELDPSIRELTITTGRKDSITCKAIGIKNVVNPFSGEKSIVNIDYLINKYSLKLDIIYVILDNDDTGKLVEELYNSNYNKTHKIKFIRMPNGIKDPYELFEINKIFIKKWMKKMRLKKSSQIN